MNAACTCRTRVKAGTGLLCKTDAFGRHEGGIDYEEKFKGGQV